MSVELLVTSNGIQSFGGFAADDTTAEEITSLIPAVLMRRATRANDRIFRRSLLRTYRAAVSQTARLCIGILRRRSTTRRSGTRRLVRKASGSRGSPGSTGDSSDADPSADLARRSRWAS